MSWLTKLVRPKLQKLVNKADVPDNLWTRCPNCEQMLFHRDLSESLFVCRLCDHHMRMDAPSRLNSLFDKQEYESIQTPEVPLDPLHFKDLKKYTERLKAAREQTNADDAVLVAKGLLHDQQVVVAVFDFAFMGGSMGTKVGESLVCAANTALGLKAPLIVVSSSGGARMQEGILSLMQMPRSVIAISRVKEARIPYISVMADPTSGGVSASFAMLGDISIAEPGAMICFTGPRVIAQTIREKLPPGFQKAEFLHSHGMVDIVVPRVQLKETLARIIGHLTNRKT